MEREKAEEEVTGMSLGGSAKEEEIISACRLSFFALSICLLFSLEVSRDTGFVVAFSIVR
jgi:hypothetical protein